MKRSFKRSAISLVIAGLSGMSYAAAPAQSMNNAFSPQFNGVYIGVEGLYVRPQNGDLDYVTISPSAVGEPFNTRQVSPDYNWNWRVYGGIKFTENDDISASWKRVRNNESERLEFDGTVVSWPRWGTVNDWTSVNGRANFDLDDVYLVWGHTVHYNNPWTFRFGGGVEYAKLDSNLKVISQDDIDIPGERLGFVADNDLKGVGPRVEMDMTYNFPAGLYFFGHVDAAAIISNRDISLTPVDPTFDGDDLFASRYEDRHVVIPKMGLKLGLGYGYTFGQAGAEGMPCQSTTLALEAGWQADTYVHAIERPDDSSFTLIAMTQSLPFADNAGNSKTSNYTDQGVFVGLKLSADWM